CGPDHSFSVRHWTSDIRHSPPCLLVLFVDSFRHFSWHSPLLRKAPVIPTSPPIRSRNPVSLKASSQNSHGPRAGSSRTPPVHGGPTFLPNTTQRDLPVS